VWFARSFLENKSGEILVLDLLIQRNVFHSGPNKSFSANQVVIKAVGVA
jgi:hypothetical protein